MVSGVTVAGEMIVYGAASNTNLEYGTLEEMGGGVLVGATGTGAIEYGGGLVLNGAVFNADNVVYEIGWNGVMNAGSVTSVSTLVVEAGALASGVTVAGAMIVSGTASNTVLQGGELEVLGNGALAGEGGSGAVVFGAGAVASGAIMNDVAASFTAAAGAQLDGGDVAAGVVLTVKAGASASGVSVTGEMIVSGTASNTILAGGALEQLGGGVLAGASGSGTIIYGSGVNLSGATMNGPAIVLEVNAGAIFKAADITSVSTVIATSGLTASAITVEGELIVNGGASVAGGLTLNGGEALIAGTVGAGQTVSFTASGGDLVIDNPAAFSASIAGMTGVKDKIDLGGFTYGAGETVSWTEAAGNTSGTLTVTDGAKTASLTLIGDYVTSNFTLSDDGIGGTYVVDPPSTGALATGGGPSVANFTQAMAAFGQTSAGASWAAQATNLDHGAVASALFIGLSKSGAG